MWRPFGACVTICVLLAGFVVAPHVHVHPASGDATADSHAGGHTVKHSHLTPHGSRESRGGHGTTDVHFDRGDHAHGQAPVLTASDFVFRTVSGPDCSSPSILRVHVPSASPAPAVSMLEAALQPPAHGPPAGRLFLARAPPPVPPAAV
jgi:hypothetical protein